MKVTAFSGSPRSGGNTEFLIREIFKVLRQEKIDTELVKIGGQALYGCSACSTCKTAKNNRCVIDADILNECLKKMIDSDGIILGSPTYFSDVTSEMKALIDRAGYVFTATKALKRKIGLAVAPARRGGSIRTFDTINHFFQINQMIIVGGNYWNDGVGLNKEDVALDSEALENMKVLGENMAWLLKAIKGGSEGGR